MHRFSPIVVSPFARLCGARACRAGLRCVASLLLAICAACASAAAQEYNFKNLSVADGLAQSQVYAICQDRRGNIWFGTRGGGLSRYDGVTFTTFAEEDGLANSFVRSILEDRAGNIWIGTDRGVSRYDGRRFVTLAAREGLGDLPVNAIVQDSSGIIWFGSEQGLLARYDGRTFRCYMRSDGVPGSKIYALFVDRSGSIWCGTENGAAMLERSGERFRHLPFGLGKASSVITGFAQDRAGSCWLSTYGGGVLRYDGGSFAQLTVDSGLSNNTVLTVAADRGGRIWLGTAGGGVCRYDGGGFTIFTETEGLCNNVITSILHDTDGNLWFGSSGGGVSRYDGERFIRFTERQGKLGNWIYTIHQDRRGAIWFGSSFGGATRYDGKLYTRYSEKDGFTAGKVKCIHEDDDGVLWFGTVGKGLYRYDGASFRQVALKDGLRAAFINAITRDRSGSLWLACADAGVVRYRPDAADAKDRFLYFGRDVGMGSIRVYAIFADDDGTIWAGTDGLGLYRITQAPASDSFSIRRFTIADGLTSNTIRSIVRDGRGNLLLGTGGGGIAIFDGRSFRSIKKGNGLSSNNIYSLLLDGSGRIWIGSEKGIDRVEVDSLYAIRSMKHYGEAEGILGVETTQNGAMLDAAGNIWFGTIHGAVLYKPREDNPNAVPPKTHLTGIRLFFNTIESTEYVDSLSAWYPIPVGLSLPYDQNHLSFDFVGISQRNPEGVRYQWKLDGFDSDWSPPTAESRAVYSNLPPGEYTFSVRSYNEDGVADPTPASFSFTITPPFWGTWWFQTLAVAGAIALITGSFLAWVGKIRRESERERRELEMRKNIVELEGKSLRLAMNPHFIFNALNSIQSFIADNNPQVARRYLTKFARLMRSILQNSREEMVLVADEVAMLEGYLELERLNAPHPFEFAIIVDPAIDPDAVAIPTMLIQPLVENAVLHGLRRKEVGGRIDITMTLEGPLLRCSVADNGIGRRCAGELAAASPKEHASTALAVIEERLAIMSHQLGIAARTETHDRYNDDGTPMGTEVVVVVPVV